MKKTIILLLLAIGACVSAQNVVDVVTLKNGSIIKGSVVDLQFDSIVKIQTSDGSLFVYKISEVESMTKETKVASVTTSSNENHSDAADGGLCYQAEQDCKLNYNGKGSHVGGVVVTSLLLSPIVGLIPAATAAGSQPDLVDLGCPSPDLYKNNIEYKVCYDEQAKKIRTKKAWTAWGVTFGVNLCLNLILFSALSN